MLAAPTKIDRIAQLLAQGLPQGMIASIVGVDSSYISQLKRDEDFVYHVASLKEEAAELNSTEESEVTNYTDKLLGVEHAVVDQLMKRVDYMETRELLGMLREVGNRNDAMRKNSLNNTIKGAIGENGATIQQTVTITVPSKVVPEIVLGPNGEIVQIGGRATTPMATGTLQKMIENMDKPSLDALDFEVINHDKPIDSEAAGNF